MRARKALCGESKSSLLKGAKSSGSRINKSFQNGVASLRGGLVCWSLWCLAVIGCDASIVHVVTMPKMLWYSVLAWGERACHIVALNGGGVGSQLY